MKRLLQAAALALALLALPAQAAGGSQVIYPSGSPGAQPVTRGPDLGQGLVTVVGVLALAGAGGWLLWRGRRLPFAAREVRKLAVEETRSLGSRQYLVVASYEGRRLLLGVCPGRIDLLTTLESRGAGEKAP